MGNMNSTATGNLEPLVIYGGYVDEWETEFYTCNRCRYKTMVIDPGEHHPVRPFFCPRCGVEFTKIIWGYGQCPE
uniref:Zinc-ribbon domain protein n=1 Tax=Myoviridae sp. ctuIn11 TaxID=2827715 RepID=A0A8S5SIS6_9CAUD|nr:MAG TPA: zinc-ribbon domain protein [Myoviridae sp. ctuIn11]